MFLHAECANCMRAFASHTTFVYFYSTFTLSRASESKTSDVKLTLSSATWFFLYLQVAVSSSELISTDVGTAVWQYDSIGQNCNSKLMNHQWRVASCQKNRQGQKLQFSHRKCKFSTKLQIFNGKDYGCSTFNLSSKISPKWRFSAPNFPTRKSLTIFRQPKM